MAGKFALIKFAKDKADIPVKHKIIRKMPEKILNRYVEKFLPYDIRDVEICGIEGFEITLPMLCGDNAALLEKIIGKVESECLDLGVKAIIADNGMPVGNDFFIPSGNLIKAFFISSIINKYLKPAKIDPAQASVIIIEGEAGYTKIIAKSIYNRFNYLGIILETSEQADYEEFSAAIFDDCGLAVNFGRRGSYLLKEADIIVNLSENPKGYETFYKKRACYIELSADREKIKNLLSKREGVIAVDKFNVEYRGELLSHIIYEMVTYLGLPDFARYINAKAKDRYFESAAKAIEKQSIKLRGLNM